MQGRTRQVHRLVRLSLLAALLSAASAPASAAPEHPGRRVLVLNSYHPRYAWTDLLTDEIVAALDGLVAREDVVIEYMDGRRYDDPRHLELLFELLKHRHREHAFDVVVAVDDLAFRFLARHRYALYPGVPVVFCGLNTPPPPPGPAGRWYAGIVEGHAIEDNLDLIERVQPGVARIVVLSDRAGIGVDLSAAAAEILAARADRGGPKLELWNDLDFRSLPNRLAALDPDSAVLVLALQRDRDGRDFAYPTDLPRLSAASPVPIYTHFGFLVGHGVIGGVLTDARGHARGAAEMVRALLEGTPIEALPVVPRGPYVERYDHRQLERFGILERRLGPAAQIDHRPFSFFRTYRSVVLGTLTVVGALVVIIFALLRALAQRDRLQAELLEREASLRHTQKMEALGVLAGGIAHDFNNILTAILGVTEILIASKPEDHEDQEDLQLLMRASNRARDLVGQILAFARRATPHTERTTLEDVGKETVALLRASLPPSVQLSLDWRSQSVVEVDPAQAQQVLMNLCTNAAHALRDDRGCITLGSEDLHLEDRRWRGRGPVEPGPHLHLWVEDDGEGIPAALLERVTEPFFTTKEPGAGTGMGLAVASGVVEAHGGHLVVESEVGRGTTVHVVLPAVQERPARATGVEEAPRGEGSILLVDDDPMAGQTLSRMLRGLGYAVTYTRSGASALARVQSDPSKFDVVLTDYSMPGLRGDQLAEALSKLGPGPVVLICTGSTDVDLEARVRACGAEALLQKPLSLASLGRALARVFEARGPKPPRPPDAEARPA